MSTPDEKWAAAEHAMILATKENQRLHTEIGKLQTENERLLYQPGLLECPKCKMRLIKNVITWAGDIAACNKPENCMNNCGPMWRVTRAGYTKQLEKDCDKMALKLKEANIEFKL